jgi:hypothetical protein
MRTSFVTLSILLLTVCGISSGSNLAIVPEPGTIMLAASGIGLAGFLTWRRRK